MSFIRLPNDPVIPKVRRPQNKTRRQDPNQETFNQELRGFLRRYKKVPKTNKTPPDYVGEARIDGVEYWVAGWIDRSSANATLRMIYQRRTFLSPRSETEERRLFEESLTEKFGADAPW